MELGERGKGKGTIEHRNINTTSVKVEYIKMCTESW
jgi:hypothetical protein